ncbi:MAG TPA: DUF2127 domain-containing protein [Bryobacteraceae bacterium]|nr:DUF2127 domain-containing protein [Bryobacteraceae bacterium]
MWKRRRRVFSCTCISIPIHRPSHAFINAATRMTDAGLWVIFSASVVYAGVPFTEAWGLWNRRVWAEWFALLSGALYLPWEMFKLMQLPNRLHLTVFLLNIAILLYLRPDRRIQKSDA